MMDYIIPSLFIISIGVFSACMIYKAIFGDHKFETGFLIFSAVTFSFAFFIYLLFTPVGGGPHYNCNSSIEQEANNIAGALASYFSEPDRTKIPSYSDLVKSGDYPLENIDLKRRDKLIKESEFSVDILSDTSDEIIIVLSCAEGKCPFDRGKCPRPFKGRFYVAKMSAGAGVWLDSWKEIDSLL